jgi:addiction module HigA family antidote
MQKHLDGLSRPVHPGEVLRDEYLAPLAMSALRLAEVLGVPADLVEDLIAERAAVTAELAGRLADALGTTPDFWLSLQQLYESRRGEP